MLHRSNGSLLPYQRPYVYAYGLNTQPSCIQSLVELAGKLNRKTVRYWRWLSNPGRVHDAEAARTSLRKAADEVFGGTPKTTARDSIRVACGTCVLEESDCVVGDNHEQSREIFLPPLLTPNIEPLPTELAAWLSKQTRTIVYIGFGTLLCPEPSLLTSLARGIKAADVAAFWALPAAHRNYLASENLPAERFFFADFLPQAALLSSGRVKCFVTHAGANSVQESLVAGVPMLCIPIIYDQHYNASVAVRLGSALRLSRRKATGNKIRSSIQELLHNQRYALRAKDLATQLSRRRDNLDNSKLWAELIS